LLLKQEIRYIPHQNKRQKEYELNMKKYIILLAGILALGLVITATVFSQSATAEEAYQAGYNDGISGYSGNSAARVIPDKFIKAGFAENYKDGYDKGYADAGQQLGQNARARSSNASTLGKDADSGKIYTSGKGKRSNTRENSTADSTH
jgi:type II secretory pathway pseudopilin PulG